MAPNLLIINFIRQKNYILYQLSKYDLHEISLKYQWTSYNSIKFFFWLNHQKRIKKVEEGKFTLKKRKKISPLSSKNTNLNMEYQRMPNCKKLYLKSLSDFFSLKGVDFLQRKTHRLNFVNCAVKIRPCPCSSGKLRPWW